MSAPDTLPEVKGKIVMFISKSGFTEAVKRRAEEEGAELVEAGELYG